MAKNDELEVITKKIETTVEQLSQVTLSGDFVSATDIYLELKSLLKNENYLNGVPHGKGAEIDIIVKKYGSMLLRYTNLGKGLGTVSKQLVDVVK